MQRDTNRIKAARRVGDETQKAREAETLCLMSLFHAVFFFMRSYCSLYRSNKDLGSELRACFTWIRGAMFGEETSEEQRNKVLDCLDHYVAMCEDMWRTDKLLVAMLAKGCRERELILEGVASLLGDKWDAIPEDEEIPEVDHSGGEEVFNLLNTSRIQSAPTGSPAPPVEFSTVISLRDGLQVHQGGATSAFRRSLDSKRRVA